MHKEFTDFVWGKSSTEVDKEIKVECPQPSISELNKRDLEE